MISFPFSTQSHWFSQPRQVLNTFSGSSSLPIHELKKATVQKPRAWIRPFPASSDHIGFSAWRLAHAIKKADCARWRSSSSLLIGTAGFLLENAHLFHWDDNQLSLNEGMADYFADFSATSLSGRIAQGMALLFLEEKGYTYIGRFESEWTRRAVAQDKSWPAGKKKAPDFIAENAERDWVLAESKGGFARRERKPNIKGALNEGLTQLDGWDKLIFPQPTKSFVIGTFLREIADTSDETSLIAFVDPEPDDPEDPVEFPPDVVRRANYAPWLSLMGFDDAANRVLTSRGEPQRRPVPVISLAGRKYAINVASVSPKYPDLSSRDFWRDFDDRFFHPYWMFKDGIRVEVLGIDFSILKILGLASPAMTLNLLELNPQEHLDAPVDTDGGAFYGSIFSDGSLLGELRFNRASRPVPDFEWIEVEL